MNPDFFEAFDSRTAVVVLNGQPISINRLGIKDHFRFWLLNHVLEEDIDKSDPVERCKSLFGMLELAVRQFKTENPVEILAAFVAAIELNKPRGIWPWQEEREMPMKADPSERDNLDYENRFLAFAVALLASEFGWSKDEIYELVPEEFGAYVHEASLLRFRRDEFQYLLSDAGLKKIGDDFVKQPFPYPPWYRKIPTRQRSTPLPSKYMPDGVIISFGPSGEMIRNEVAKDENRTSGSSDPSDADV